MLGADCFDSMAPKMQFDVKQAVAAALTVGMVLMLLNMIHREHIVPLTQSSTSEESASIVSAGEESATEVIKTSVVDDTPKQLWGRPGPVLKPCWGKHITSREGKTWGYVMVRLSNGPPYHRSQVADAVIVARILGATLLLPTIKEAATEPESAFEKIYDVNNFISSLKDVVRVVGRAPEDVRSSRPAIVRVPYKVTPEYIEENIRPIFAKKRIIQIVIVFSTSSLKIKDSSTDEIQAIRCLVTYNALKFSSQVQKIGQQVISKAREASGSAGGRLIALDLRVDVLKQKGCRQSEKSESKKCFNADDVGIFLKELGFSSNTAIYLTQPNWDRSLDQLKDIFPNIYIKEDNMPVHPGNTQFDKAVDFYVCSHSDVFVPAISGIFYASVAGERISMGKTQILVPTVNLDSTPQSKVSGVLSRFVAKKDHAVYSCFCKSSSNTSKAKKGVL